MKSNRFAIEATLNRPDGLTKETSRVQQRRGQIMEALTAALDGLESGGLSSFVFTVTMHNGARMQATTEGSDNVH